MRHCLLSRPCHGIWLSNVESRSVETAKRRKPRSSRRQMSNGHHTLLSAVCSLLHIMIWHWFWSQLYTKCENFHTFLARRKRKWNWLLANWLVCRLSQRSREILPLTSRPAMLARPRSVQPLLDSGKSRAVADPASKNDGSQTHNVKAKSDLPSSPAASQSTSDHRPSSAHPSSTGWPTANWPELIPLRGMAVRKCMASRKCIGQILYLPTRPGRHASQSISDDRPS